MLTNLLLGFITAMGFLLVFLAISSQRKPSGFERIERLSQGHSAADAAPRF